jgi:hypothetical protein
MKIKICQFDVLDKDGDIILSEGITFAKELPILWNWNTERPPLAKLNPHECKLLFAEIFGCNEVSFFPEGIIKKMRKPTKKERAKNKHLKRIIEEIELIAFSVVPKPPNEKHILKK